MRRWLVGFLTAIALIAANGVASAATKYSAPAQEEADGKVVEAAAQAGFAGRRQSRPKLEAVMAHAPASYPTRELVGDTIVIRNYGGGPETLGALLVEVAAQKDGAPGREVVVVQNVYGLAAMMLGSFAVEDRDYRGGIAWLDKGLALQPDNLMLASEKGQALGAVKRFADGLAVVDAAIAANHDGLDLHGNALINRTRGFMLIELDRLDEAEAAYKKALVLEPGHAGATRELEYIAKLRAGASPADHTPALQQGEQAAKPAP